MTADRPTGVDQFESALRDILRAEADVRMPEHLARALDETIRTTPTSLQQGWRPASATGLLRSTFGATRFVVAAVIVALFGGLLLAGVLTTQPEETRPAVGATTTPESTTTPPIELPAEIPDGIEWGTLETPVGPARWVRLTGDETMIPPDLAGLISTPDGFVLLKGSSWTSGGGEAELWWSPDLISWTSEPLGIEARNGELSWAGDAYWLNVHEPSSLWRSPDTKSWEQVDLEGLVPPGPDGYAWTLGLGRPLTHGGVTIVPFEWLTDWSVVVRGLPGADELIDPHLKESAPGIFDIESYGPDTFATVRFEETEDGLLVIDHEDGTELKVLEGVSMEFIKLLTVQVESRFDEIGETGGTGLAIVDGTVLVEVEPPLEAERADHQAFKVDGDGFVSYTVVADGLVHVHRSPDGREWSETDLIGDDADEPTDITSVWTARGAVSVGTSEGERTSTDGLTWESGPEDGWPTDITPRPTPEGPMAMGGNPVLDPGEGVPAFNVRGCLGGQGRLSPNTMTRNVDEQCTGGEREVLIITFDDVPA